MNLTEAQAILNKWIAADTATQKGQSYSIDGLSLTRTDADQITNKIDYWQSKVNELIDLANGSQPGVAIASFNH
ncbi:hypothetical protein DRH27_05000 [Candidatus Falkowbacteria bacterium]|nr:MAG: hypothetical protein DRH27_05000 [Candidatus Falkowbacteria bacterium]